MSQPYPSYKDSGLRHGWGSASLKRYWKSQPGCGLSPTSATVGEPVLVQDNLRWAFFKFKIIRKHS